MSLLSGLFKDKVSSYLGIDLGTGSLKVVELENAAGRPRLVTYGLVEVETDVSREAAPASQEKIAAVLKDLLVRAHTRSRAAVAALPNFSVFSSVLSLPDLGNRDLTEAIQWEAKKFVPMPIENVVLDWKIIGKDEPVASGDQPKPLVDKKMTKILLTAAPKHLIERYVNIFKLAGLNLLSLETESFALGRSLVGNDPTPILIADVGSLTTDLTVVEGGVPVLAHPYSFDAYGKVVNKTVERNIYSVAPVCRWSSFDRSLTTNFQDLWWNPDESGWGLNLAYTWSEAEQNGSRDAFCFDCFSVESSPVRPTDNDERHRIVANGIVITVDGGRRILNPGSVAVNGTQIVAVDTPAAIAARYRSADTIDATGKVVMPGLINTHTHAAMVMFRGLGNDLAWEPVQKAEFAKYHLGLYVGVLRVTYHLDDPA